MAILKAAYKKRPDLKIAAWADAGAYCTEVGGSISRHHQAYDGDLLDPNDTWMIAFQLQSA